MMVCSGTASWLALLMAALEMNSINLKWGGGQQELILFVVLIPTVLSEYATSILTYVLWVCEYEDKLHCQQFICSQGMSTGTIYP